MLTILLVSWLAFPCRLFLMSHLNMYEFVVRTEGECSGRSISNVHMYAAQSVDCHMEHCAVCIVCLHESNTNMRTYLMVDASRRSAAFSSSPS
jgi:hypothetical protein